MRISHQDWLFSKPFQHYFNQSLWFNHYSQSWLVIDLNLLVVNVHIDLLSVFSGADLTLNLNVFSTLKIVPSFLMSVTRLHISILISPILIHGEHIHLTLSMMLFLLAFFVALRMWNGSPLLDLFLFFGWGCTLGHSTFLTNVHVSINRVLLLGSKQACVVFCQVLLLSMANLAAHDETRAKLYALLMNVLWVWNEVFPADRFKCRIRRWLYTLVKHGVPPQIILKIQGRFIPI